MHDEQVEDILIEKHSVSQLFKDLSDMKKTGEDGLDQARLTNGRVTKLESQSLGAWVHRHPYRFAAAIVFLCATVISDFRNPIIDFLVSKIV